MTTNSAVADSSADTDAVLATLADGRRRVILRSLERAAGNERSVEELATAILDEFGGDQPVERPSEHRIITELYHSHLPALEEMEMVVHDSDDGVVWGDADESTLELLDLLEQFEATQ